MLTGAKVRYKGLLCASVFSLSTGVVMVALTAVVLRLRGSPAEASEDSPPAATTSSCSASVCCLKWLKTLSQSARDAR